ncbi:MAG: phosphotransferase family protein [Halobacteriaceae archaeon]
MTRQVRDALASHTDDLAVRRELHAVPPHAVHEVTFEGQRAVCKLAAGPRADPAREAGVLRYVGERTSVPVPEVLAVGDDHFVAAWEEALPPADPPVTERRLRALGAGLATLHAETAGDFDATGAFRAEGSALAVDADETWADTLCALLADWGEFLAAFGHADLAAAVRERPAPYGSPEPVLVHGNYLPDHVGLTDGGDVACVIDWEHAVAGSAGFDYLCTALPLFGGPSDPGHPEAVFREAYESVRPLPDGFDERRDALERVLLVSYLKSLYLQNEVDGETEARGEALAAHLRERLDAR